MMPMPWIIVYFMLLFIYFMVGVYVNFLGQSIESFSFVKSVKTSETEFCW